MVERAENNLHAASNPSQDGEKKINDTGSDYYYRL